MAATLDSIEGILSDIKTDVGGFISTTPKAKNNQVTYNVFNRGMENLLKKLDNIASGVNGIKNASGSNNGGNSGNGKNIVSKISEMAGYTQTINKNINQILSVLNTLNGNNANVATGSGSNVTNVPDELKHIDKNIEGVFNYVAEIVNLLSDGNSKNIGIDPNSELGIALKKMAEEKAERELKNWENSKEERDFEDRKKKAIQDVKKGEPGAKEELRKILKEEKEEKEQNKTLKKIEKKAEKGKGWKGISGVAGAANAILTAENAGAVADKGIGAISQLGPAGAAVGGVLGLIKTLFEMGAVHDKATTEYARTIGGYKTGKRGAGAAADRLIDDGSLIYRRGYKTQDIYSALTSAAEAIGRSTEHLSKESLASAIDLKRFGIEPKAIEYLDTFGKSVAETDRFFADVYNSASKKGLSFKNVSKVINDNLKAAQTYSFSNGLKGLEKMAEKSVQLKYNMQQVFQLADRTSDVEGAIKTAANLSVLGGTFAQNSNPMQLLYESLADVESLQERIERMYSNKAHWDYSKGEMSMDPQQRIFVKESAKTMGMNPDEAISLAMNQAKFKHVERQIGTGISNEVANYIKNIAEIQSNGKATVTIGNETKNVSELTEKDKSALKREYEKKEKEGKLKLGDIYENTKTVTERLDNILEYLKTKLGRWVYKIMEWFSDDYSERARGDGDVELQDLREELYGTGPESKKRADQISEMSREEVLAAFENKGMHKEENGIMPNFSKIGENGIVGGRTHLEGGVQATYNDMPVEIEKGETLINKISSKRYNNILSDIQNGSFNPYSYSNKLMKNDMEKYYGSLSVAPVKQNTSISGNQPSYGNSQLSVNGRINIPETITIKVENGSTIGNLDTNAITSMVAMQIMQEWKKQENFSGFDKENFPYKNVIGV